MNLLLQRNPLGRFLARHLVRSVEYRSIRARYMQLGARWPFKDQTVDVVYGSHVFEHLTLSQGEHFLNESRRVLRPGGCLRLVVPNLAALAKIYLEGYSNGDKNAGKEFLYALNLHRENVYRQHRLLARIIASFQGWPHQHKYMYDTLSLSERIGGAGFSDVRVGGYGSSDYIPEIKQVECTAEGIPALYVEALRH